jgi:hypothetical protein
LVSAPLPLFNYYQPFLQMVCTLLTITCARPGPKSPVRRSPRRSARCRSPGPWLGQASALQCGLTANFLEVEGRREIRQMSKCWFLVKLTLSDSHVRKWIESSEILMFVCLHCQMKMSGSSTAVLGMLAAPDRNTSKGAEQ